MFELNCKKKSIPKLTLVGILGLSQFFCIILFDSPSNRKENAYQIQVLHDGTKEQFVTILEADACELSQLLETSSILEKPSLRFLTTNTSIEVIQVQGWNNTWKEGWVLLVDGKIVSGEDLKKGFQVNPSSQIILEFRPLERKWRGN